MKRSSTTSRKGGAEKNPGYKYNEEAIIDWELRPGGMLVQKRCVRSGSAAATSGPMIKIKVSHGSYHHDVTVSAQSTFGDLKRVLANETGLEPKEQRLLFRGKEKNDEECLHMVGVKDMSKLILLEDPASKERKLEEMERNQGILKAYEAVAKVRAEVDKLSDKVVALETAVRNGTKVAAKEFIILTELLMVQLLKLDTIEADGEAKVQRRIEEGELPRGFPWGKSSEKQFEVQHKSQSMTCASKVRRVQSLVDALDNLKTRNSNPFTRSCNAVSMTAKWETFDSGVGSLNAPNSVQSSTKITQDWELFD